MSRFAASNEVEKTDRPPRQNIVTIGDVLLYDAGVADGKAQATKRIVAWLREAAANYRAEDGKGGAEHQLTCRASAVALEGAADDIEDWAPDAIERGEHA